MTSTFNHDRNGTSQSQRDIDALRPDFFLLEERNIVDLILLARRHAEVLKYYDSNNQVAGNWAAFLDGDPEEMALFLKDPGFFDAFPEKKAKYSRPHLVLFLVFLQLLQESHSLVNKLTKKQLDFYFRQALRFDTKKAIPDRVHVLANIQDDETKVLIPKGTLLDAGENGQGDPVEYSTDHDLIADHSRVGRLMSLYVEKEVTGIAQVRENADRGERFLSVLNLVYRKPDTKNSPRNYPESADVPPDRLFGQGIIVELDALRKTIADDFKLRIAAFQRLMEDYALWANENTWKTVNEFLLITFNEIKKSTNGSGEKRIDEVFDDIRDFDKNFETALGFTVEGKSGTKNVFDGIPAVDNIYDLYDYNIRFPESNNIISFITERFKQGTSEFRNFMDARLRILRYMESIHEYLKTSEIGSQRSSAVKPSIYVKDKTLVQSFSNILGVKMIGGKAINNDEEFVNLERQLENLEKYFRMPAEDYFFVRDLYLAEDAADVPKWKWERADKLLKHAYQSWLKVDLQTKAGNKEQVDGNALKKAEIQNPEIITWKNIYKATDATKLLAISDAGDEPFPRWKTFGSIHSDDSDSTEIGLGISSPALSLSEGTRVLTLRFTFNAEGFEAQRETLKNYLNFWNAAGEAKKPFPFLIQVSTGKGWVTLEDWESFEITPDKPVMTIVVTAKEDIDPFEPLADDAGPDPLPWLRVLLNKDAFEEKSPRVYELFKEQSLVQLKVGIKVTGLKNLLVQNKEGGIDPKKPFDIFGSVPERGDRLYITHPELAAQKLDSLTLNIEWKNLPEKGLAEYYQSYGNVILDKAGKLAAVNDDSFLVSLSLVEARRRMSLPSDGSNKNQLFPKKGGTETKLTVDLPDMFDGNVDSYMRKMGAKTDQEVDISERYFELELQPQDFLHKKFAVINQNLANISLSNMKSKTLNGVTTIEYVLPVLNEPYTPTVKSFVIDYETSLELAWDKKALNRKEDRVAHIEPFGVYFLPDSTEPVPFLPDFEKEGTLFIGLENLDPPQNLSFLFQLGEGTADPDLEPSQVTWSYLRGNDWKTLEKDRMLTDTTGGLLNSGLIEINIPADASLRHQRMPDGLYWLKAEVERFTRSLSDCIDIRTQAVSATWVDSGNVSDHLNQPLAPETISQPVAPMPGISSFTQPFSSFLGKVAEADDQLYRRASGVLRHKRRALTIWDYENLILEEFPDIFRAKAITSDVWGDDYEPGSVRIVVIPDIRKRKPFDPFEPKVPVGRLRDIQKFLQQCAPAFARIYVQNARFRYLQLRIFVRFHDMNNFGFYAGKLNRELVEYLAPWAFDNSSDIVFGGKINPSVIVNFIEDRPYVDYIDKPGLQLMERKTGGSFRVVTDPAPDDEQGLSIKEADVVIVSAHQHIIESLALPEDYVKSIRQGIGFAKIEFDFRILTKEEAKVAPN